VIGGGVSGLAAGLALANAGFRVSCLSPDLPSEGPGDTIEPVPPDLRVFAISASSRSLLDRVGAWSSMTQERIAPVSSMCVFPAAGDEALPIDFYAQDADLARLANIVEQSNLLSGLTRAAGDSRLRMVSGELDAIASLPAGDQVELKLVGGDRIRCRLVVGADGAGSVTRRLAGIPTTTQAYQQTAVVARLQLASPHANTAFQWFGEHGIVALLPQPDWPLPVRTRQSGPGHQVSLVWSADPRTAAELVASPDLLPTMLEPVCGPVVGACEVVSDIASFPLVRQQADSLCADRVVLVGDAAHVVHPLAGQGLNLGLADVGALTSVLTRAKDRWQGPRFDPGAPILLRRYQRHRAEPLLAMQSAIDGLQRLFAPHGGSGRAAVSGPVATARDLGWNLVASSERLRRLIIKYAAGGV
jgi:ubiquinone biosynthesis UbiH/UbiF/VisC/COQ6 family hydroxylase